MFCYFFPSVYSFEEPLIWATHFLSYHEHTVTALVWESLSKFLDTTDIQPVVGRAVCTAASILTPITVWFTTYQTHVPPIVF